MMRNFRIIALYLLFQCAFNICYSQAYCDFNAELKSIYRNIINLEFALAKNALGNKAETSPNKGYILLENEWDFFHLYIYEHSTEYKKRKSSKQKRLDRIDDSDLSLEWKRFLKAEILLQWALIHLKHGDDFLAFQSIRKSVQLLEENVYEYPKFIYSYKSLGVLHTLLSTIPSGFQWAAGLLGLSGNLKTGKAELQKYILKAEPVQDIFLEESYAAMAFIISFLENKPPEAYDYWIKKSGINEPGPLQILVQCKLALHAGFNEGAIHALKSFSHQEKQKLPYLFYLSGLCNLQKLLPNADTYFLKFLEIHKGYSYVKETYQKLAWNALLKGEKGLYHLYISNCLTKGSELTDEDIQAKQEALNKKIPDVLLLKARLLYDGGYFHQAYELLISQKQNYYLKPEHKLEYAYRMGRICQMKNEPVQSLQFYNDALRFDPEGRSYMYSNSLLQIAILFESQNKKTEARMYFKKVLDTDPEMYKRSIHQKAKTGLARL